MHNIPIIKANGLLFVGDPHQSSKKPGSRTDENFSQTIASKLHQARQIAKDNKLIFVCLGDLFDKDNDTDAAMLSSTILSLRKEVQDLDAYTIIGNHEKRMVDFSYDTSLGIILSTGHLKEIKNNEISFIVESTLNGEPFYTAVGGTYYDQIIPDDIRDIVPPGVHEVVWVTHHDLTFDGKQYPNTIEPKEILGCHMVVNGHIHSERKPKKVGDTIYYNPGNITRRSIDTHDHIPRVWKYTPGNSMLSPIQLEYKKDVFDWTGRRVHASNKLETENSFVSLMINEIDNNSNDADKFLKRMQDHLESIKADDFVKNYLQEIYKEIT